MREMFTSGSGRFLILSQVMKRLLARFMNWLVKGLGMIQKKKIDI
jgi:hypothetical protein